VTNGNENAVGCLLGGDPRLHVAQAYRAQKVADAEGEAERFTKLLAEYERNPGVTRERLYIETIETVLASSRKVLLDTDGKGSLIYLPLDKLTEQARRPQRSDANDSSLTIERPAVSNAGSPTGDRRSRGTR